MMRERHHHAGAREFALLVTWRWRLAGHWLGWVLLVGSSSWAIDLRWSELPPLPNEHGWGGPYVGVHDDVLIVAGGANFPQGPPWGDAPGPKVWYDTVFVLQQPDGEWLPAGRLPRRLAYGGCISRTDGCWLLGGEEDGRAVSDVYRLTWDRQHQRVRVSSGPSLPFPAAYLAAAGDDNGMFVAASRRRAGAERMNEKYFGFWAGPAAEEAAGVEGHDGRGWESLPTWPGAPRHKAAACWQPGTDGNGAFYLISGSRPFWRPDNTQDLAKFEFLTDGYRFDPQAKTWHALPPLPRTTDPSAERGRQPPTSSGGGSSRGCRGFVRVDLRRSDRRRVDASGSGASRLSS